MRIEVSGLDRRARALVIFEQLKIATRSMVQPASNQVIEQFGRKPFLILISCLLSLRTKDTVSFPASQRLFSRAQTPQELLKISLLELEKIIYPVAFYRKRAVNLHAVSLQLIEQFGGEVPSDVNQLRSLSGVGPKTANLVLAEGFRIPAICVDTHVHRIANRLGLVETTTPEQTEAALRDLLPPELWIDCNRLLVTWGQNICVPISPKCSQCAIAPWCPRIGVTTSR
jgi:endonuclease-3